jgi:hypothetical protein
MTEPDAEPVERRRLAAPTPAGGWTHPWPNAIEVARVLPTERWTLVGGLMVQAHALAHGIDAIRPTDDLDLLLHIEMIAGLPGQAVTALESLGYQLRQPAHRKGAAYRFERPRPEFGARGVDRIDVMNPDHPGHQAATLRRSPMFEVPGGKQALDRTATFAITSEDGTVVDFSIPDELGALILKAAAHLSDRTRERERHLLDAAVLAATITDHRRERARRKGSDGKRLRHLATQLADPRHPAWLRLPEPHRTNGQDTLRILTT